MNPFTFFGSGAKFFQFLSQNAFQSGPRPALFSTWPGFEGIPIGHVPELNVRQHLGSHPIAGVEDSLTPAPYGLPPPTDRGAISPLNVGDPGFFGPGRFSALPEGTAAPNGIPGAVRPPFDAERGPNAFFPHIYGDIDYGNPDSSFYAPVVPSIFDWQNL
jgi:hypothetical protein